MVNRVILIGNLGGDPEVRRLESGAVVAKFSVATNENYKDKSGEWQTLTEWHDIVAWRNLAERAEQSLKKGTTIYVEGKLTHRKWEDADGNKRKTTEVVANYFRVINRVENQSSGGNYFPNEESSLSQEKAQASASVNEEVSGSTEEDDLPF